MRPGNALSPAGQEGEAEFQRERRKVQPQDNSRGEANRCLRRLGCFLDSSHGTRLAFLRGWNNFLMETLIKYIKKGKLQGVKKVFRG